MSNVKRLIQLPKKQSYFLFGPRGTGKSTQVKMSYPDALYIDLLLTDVRRRFEAYPEELVKVVRSLKEGAVVIIDEIQKVPELLSIIHALIEEKKEIQFVLTGSSARKLRHAGVDFLAGRAIRKEMHPFMAAEISKLFDLEKAIKLGMLPLIWEADEPAEVLKSYVNLYVLEEVQFEALVRNIGSFTRFLSTIAFSHGSQLNLTNVARECEVKRSTAENFLSILRDLLLSYELPIFTNRARRMLSGHSKFYLFDSGVFRAMRKMGPLDAVTEVEGAALEGLVLQHLKAWCEYTRVKYELFYWRTKAGLEVDFIIYGEEGFWAIEVKNSRKISCKDVRALRHFKEDYPECKPLLLYRGDMTMKEGDIICQPVEEFLKNLQPNLPPF